MKERLAVDYRWSQRQRTVLALLASGKTNLEIAEVLGISRDGAKWHVGEILGKLGAASREEAAEYWRHYTGVLPRLRRVFPALVGSALVKWGSLAVALGVGGVALAGWAGIPSAAGPDTPAVGTSSPTTNPPSTIVFSGRITAISGPVIVVPYDSKEYRVAVTNTTKTIYLNESRWIVETDAGSATFAVGDHVEGAAIRRPDGTLEATSLTRNGFIGRSGAVVSVDGDAIEVRLLSPVAGRALYESTTTKVRLAANAINAKSRVPLLGTSGLVVGQYIAFDGFIADDGSLVVYDLDPGNGLPLIVGTAAAK